MTLCFFLIDSGQTELIESRKNFIFWLKDQCHSWCICDALGARDYLPDGIPDDPPVEPGPRVFFDK